MVSTPHHESEPPLTDIDVTDESREAEPSVVLTVHAPDEQHDYFRIDFNASTNDEAFVYNRAIRDSLKKVRLIPYETTGQNNEPNDTAGHHSWMASVSHRGQVRTTKQLEDLLPMIHRAAARYRDLLP